MAHAVPVEGPLMQMPEPTRRAVLGGAAAVAGGLALDAGAAAPAAAAPAATTASLLPADPFAHLLRRATYGPTPASLAEATRLGVGGWLDRQLNPAAIADADCDALLARLPLANADITTARAKLAKNSYDG